MRPKTLSASAAHVFEMCPARYKATNIDYTPDENNSAADLGTVCHAALEHFVANNEYKLTQTEQEAYLLAHYERAYADAFPDRTRFTEGWNMVSEWRQRTDLLDGRTVISTEKKSSFMVPTSVGDLKFNYIMDRMDRLANGGIEVIDYKTVSQPIAPEDLKNKIQPRVYAMAAAIEYPDAPEIWVTFDLLRFDQVGIKFTREDNIATWKHLKALAERIIASPGTEERLNPECRFCVRKGACKTLQKNVAAGGKFAIDDLPSAIERRAELDYAQSAINTMIDDLDKFILLQARENEVTSFETDGTIVDIGSRGRRSIDSRMAARVLGPELMAERGTLSMKDIDAILKDTSIPQTTRAELKQLIRKQWGEPTVKTKPKDTNA